MAHCTHSQVSVTFDQWVEMCWQVMELFIHPAPILADAELFMEVWCHRAQASFSHGPPPSITGAIIMRGLEDNVQLVMMDYCQAEAMTLLPDFLQNVDLVQLPLPAITVVSTPSPPLLPSSDSVESLFIAMQTAAKAPIGEVVYAGDQPHSQHLASQLSSLVANSQLNPLAPS